MASLVTASDAFMLGFLDQDSLSASSLAGQTAFVFSLFYGAFVFGLNVLAAQYWGKGDLKTAEEVLAVTLSVVVNIVLNACLIFGLAFFPKMGIRGAALATVLARLFETVFVLTVVARKKMSSASYQNDDSFRKQKSS